jgi:peptide/nickel transport system substrate-binding protein
MPRWGRAKGHSPRRVFPNGNHDAGHFYSGGAALESFLDPRLLGGRALPERTIDWNDDHVLTVPSQVCHLKDRHRARWLRSGVSHVIYVSTAAQSGQCRFYISDCQFSITRGFNALPMQTASLPLSAMRTGAAVFLTLCISACSDHSAKTPAEETGGTLVISTTGDPGTLFPPLIRTTQGKQISEQIYDFLADVGPEMNTLGEKGFRPQLTDGWRWSADSLSLAFHLNPAARWHDGKPVTAHDVQFTFALNKNPALGGMFLSELENIDSVTTSDSLTAVFWFHERLPTQFLDAAAQLLILPAHQLERLDVKRLRESPVPTVGTGRFRLHRWDKGSSVEIVADPANYRGRAKLDRVIWTVSPDFTPAVTRLFSGDADLFDALTPENLAELTRHPNIRAVILPGTDYAFLQFNLRDPAKNAEPHPLFGERALRRAVAMSIDRSALVKNVLDTLGRVGIGPAVRAFPTTDTLVLQIPFDSAGARAIFDSLGWSRRDGSGIRTKQGRKLEFNLLVPSSSTNRKRLAVLLQAQLKRMGIRVDIEQMDNSAFMARQQARTFDALLAGSHMGASPDGTRLAWTSAGVGKDGTNYGSYENPIFDAQLETALLSDAEHARKKFTLAYTTINADAPAVWLYEPRTVIGLHKRIRTGWMRPDAWWADLADWHIPRSERIQRDGVPSGS